MKQLYFALYTFSNDLSNSVKIHDEHEEDLEEYSRSTACLPTSERLQTWASVSTRVHLKVNLMADVKYKPQKIFIHAVT